MKRKLLVVFVAVISAIYLAVGLSACDLGNNENGTTSVTSVTLDKTSLELSVGESYTLSAAVLPSSAADKSVTWSSSANSVATVLNGEVTAVSEGTAVITVTTTDGGYKDTCTVTVTQPQENPSAVSVTSVSLSKTTLSLETGESYTLTATISPSNATNQSVTWASSNSSVAAVSGGTVTALSTGTATITVTTDDGNYTAECLITVAEQIISVTSVSLDNSAVSLTTGESYTLAATVLPSNATNQSVTWASSDSSVAEVSGGKVTAVAAGTAVITVTTQDGEFTDTCTVTVSENLKTSDGSWNVTVIAKTLENWMIENDYYATMNYATNKSDYVFQSILWVDVSNSELTFGARTKANGSEIYEIFKVKTALNNKLISGEIATAAELESYLNSNSAVISNKQAGVKCEYTTFDDDYETEHKEEFETLTTNVFNRLASVGYQGTSINNEGTPVDLSGAKVLFGFKTEQSESQAGLDMGYNQSWNQYYLIELNGEIMMIRINVHGENTSAKITPLINVLNDNSNAWMVATYTETEVLSQNINLYPEA